MRNCIIIIFISLGFLLSGQGGFKKKHYLKNTFTGACRDVIEAPNGKFIAVGITTDSALGAYRLTVLGMDAQGNPLWKKSYGSQRVLYFDNDMNLRGPLIYDSTGFYHALCATDSSFGRTFGVLIKFNYNGDTLWQRIYRDPDPLEDVMPQALALSVDGGFLMTGLFQNWGSGYNRCLILKTDKNGKELWRKKISKAVPDVQDGKSVVQDSATKKIVIVGYQLIGNANSAGTFGNVLITDSLGVKLLQTTYNNYDGGGFSEVIQLRDKNFLLCGGTNANSNLGNLIRSKGLVVKFALNGNKIWSKTYDTLSYYNSVGLLHEMPNQDILMAGGLDTMLNYNIEEEIRIKIARTDKNGNRRWQRNIGSTGTHDEFPRSLNRTKDGGFVLAVWDVLMDNPRPYSIIKIDSTACDTLEAYCRSVGLGFGSKYKKRGFIVEVFPNPTTDLINITIAAPPDKKFILHIKDVYGREIEEIYLNSELKLKINTSNFEAGVFFLDIVDQGVTIETKKLVIIK